MKTFATTLLLLASATAAYGHSPKASKANISNNLSYSFIQSKSTKSSKAYEEPIRGRRLLGEDHVQGGGKLESRNLHHKTSMSYHHRLFRQAKMSKTKSEKEVVLFSEFAKSEKEAVQSSVASAASVKSSKAQFGRALHKRSEDLIDGSLSLELSPRTYPKSGKASSKATVFVIDAKSSKAVPVKVKRSIDPVEEVSNDQAEPTALSFIEYRPQTPVASKEEASGASALIVASVSVGTLLAVSAFALN